MITKKYTVDGIVDGRKVVLLDREDENVQVVVDADKFARVNEGDIVLVTWTVKLTFGDTSFLFAGDADKKPSSRC